MAVSLIVTTYNRPDALRLVLLSALDQTTAPDEIIIADDGSSSDTRDLIEEFRWACAIPIHHSWQEDEGFRAAMSRNKAIAKAKYSYVIVIDGDMILHPKFIEDHLNFSRRGTFVQGARAKLSEEGTKDVLAEGRFRFDVFDRALKSRRYGLWSPFLKFFFSGEPRVNQTDMIQTCNMAFFRTDCISVNGFNEKFVGWGREDTEFGIRLINSGIQRRNLKFAAIAYHLHHDGESRGSLVQNDLILQQTIDRSLIRCEDGIDKYLKQAAQIIP
jgi:glycosyltransferase involved in cell wall biosynthesis